MRDGAVRLPSPDIWARGIPFEEAIADFAVAYVDQTERDYQALVDAVKSGRLTAETGI